MHLKPNFFDKPVNGRWSIKSKLKQGGFGSVYLAKDLKNEKKVHAIKLIPTEGRRYADIQEKMYGLIEKEQFTTGFIKYFETGDFMNHRYMLMELIGKDLEQIKKITKNENLSMKSVLMLGLQAVDRLQALHKIGYLHRDVKPDNIAIGLNEKDKVIYLFDFGLALPIGCETPKQEKGRVVGTPGFMSCRAHQGKEQGPSDDLQSLIYTLLYLAEGSLPWLKIRIQTSADFHKILLMKRGLGKKLFKNEQISSQLFELLSTFQNTKPNGKIDYLKVKYKLLQMLKKRKQQNDFQFQWCGNTNRSFSPKSKKKNLSPQDSPRKNKKLELMNQQNQKLVQNQIYQVYKFIDDGKQKRQKLSKAKRQSPKKGVAYKKSPKKQQIQQKKIQKKVRPASAMNRPKNQQKPNKWDKIMFFEQSNMVSGPKIVINKTAKHKI